MGTWVSERGKDACKGIEGRYREMRGKRNMALELGGTKKERGKEEGKGIEGR